MVAHLVERSPVTEGLETMLASFFVGLGEAGSDLQIRIGEAPKPEDLLRDDRGKLINPYAIIYPWPSVGLYGTMAYPESGARLLYEITSVGRTDNSAGIMADRVRRGVLERASNGSFVRTIPAGASMTVIDRAQAEIGLAVPQAGLWNVHDVFALEVQADA